MVVSSNECVLCNECNECILFRRKMHLMFWVFWHFVFSRSPCGTACVVGVPHAQHLRAHHWRRAHPSRGPRRPSQTHPRPLPWALGSTILVFVFAIGNVCQINSVVDISQCETTSLSSLTYYLNVDMFSHFRSNSYGGHRAPFICRSTGVPH